MKKYNGGAAFPAAFVIGETYDGGMTLRDYFAAAALQGQMSNNESIFSPSKEQAAKGITWANIAANEAYVLADAMLAERDK